MRLESIDLILENCEIIHIEGKHVGFFLVDNIHSSFQRWGANCIDKIDWADTFVIEIHKDANTEYSSFGIEDLKRKKFDRINEYWDITQIRFVIDGKEYHYWLNWADGRDEVNLNQEVFISKEGHLFIKVVRGKTLADFFPIKYLNDDEDINESFSWYSMSNK